MKPEKKRIGLTGKLVGGMVLLGLILCLASCLIGYQRFTTVLERQYNDAAYEIAETALSYVDGDRVEEYLRTGKTDGAYDETLAKLDVLVDTMEANFIYVAAVDPADFTTLTYVYDSLNSASDFSRYELGYTAPGIDPQYRDGVVALMTEGKRIEQYTYSYNDESGAHTTAALPVRDGQGRIVAMLGVEKTMTELEAARSTYVLWVVAATVASVAVFILLYIVYLHRAMIRPVLTVTEEASLFTRSETQISQRLPQIKNRDEIGTLAQAVYKMEVDIRQYIDNLTAVTAEKERIGAELGVATHIQASMLPCIFPAFPDRPEIDIYATMQPAKEVGGDFYDFFLVDEDHLALVIADVSGKGVPAALFMVIAKTLLKNSAQAGLSPKAVLEKVNNQLYENNEAEMFVTVWLGILEISTGRLTAANAGHEYPALRHAGGGYEMIRDKHGFVLAGLPDTRYREYELTLEPGDQLYVYTDGVTEATDAHDTLFGEERVLEALNAHRDARPQELLPAVKACIDAFVAEAPQFDDITMLSMRYLGPAVRGDQEEAAP